MLKYVVRVGAKEAPVAQLARCHFLASFHDSPWQVDQHRNERHLAATLGLGPLVDERDLWSCSSREATHQGAFADDLVSVGPRVVELQGAPRMDGAIRHAGASFYRGG
mmetsp:Transcript_81404/g.141310  ORF Transcript_81404/g.141310 Transcript_81404/m.141310 type:complete len:108 (-) Transcript_81404:148-471(-)